MTTRWLDSDRVVTIAVTDYAAIDSSVIMLLAVSKGDFNRDFNVCPVAM